MWQEQPVLLSPLPGNLPADRGLCSPPQMHPLGLCNSNDEEDLYEYGWVGVVKLEQPDLEPKPCLTVLGKVSACQGRLWKPRAGVG